MVQVTLSGIIEKQAGISELEIEAKNVRQLLLKLEARCPELSAELDKGVAVSIDGTLYQDDLTQPIPEEAEVYIIPRLAGG